MYTRIWLVTRKVALIILDGYVVSGLYSLSATVQDAHTFEVHSGTLWVNHNLGKESGLSRRKAIGQMYVFVTCDFAISIVYQYGHVLIADTEGPELQVLRLREITEIVPC